MKQAILFPRRTMNKEVKIQSFLLGQSIKCGDRIIARFNMEIACFREIIAYRNDDNYDI